MNIDPTQYGYVINSSLYCPKCVAELDLDVFELQARGECYVLFSSDEPIYAGETCTECDELIFDPHEYDDDNDDFDPDDFDPDNSDPIENTLRKWLYPTQEEEHPQDDIFEVGLAKAIEKVDQQEAAYLEVWLPAVNNLKF